MTEITGREINRRQAQMQPLRDPPWTIENDLVERVCGHALELGQIALELTFDSETLGSTDETRVYLRHLRAEPCPNCARGIGPWK